MKQLQSFVMSVQRLLLAVLLPFVAINIYAQDMVIGGIGYNFIADREGEVEVTFIPDAPYSGDIVIPAVAQGDAAGYIVTAIGNNAFMNCTDVTSVSIPGTVNTIGGLAFQGCSSMASVNIPDSVEIIGVRAFFGCQSLTEIIVPDHVWSIEDYTFYDCTNLTSVTLPDNIESIGECAFQSCGKLSNLVLPANLAVLGANALSGTSLTSLTLPAGLTYIGNSAFSGSALTSISIPEGIIEIGEQTFHTCVYLTSVTLPDGLESIGKEAFFNCQRLSSIDIPESVNSIGEGAFESCSSLTSIELPANIRYVDARTFQNCIKLESVTIPSGISTIAGSAFAYCPALTDVTNFADNPQEIADDAFTYFDATLHVKHGLHIIYKEAPVWQNFARIIDDADGNPTQLPDYFFYEGLYYNKVSENTVEVAQSQDGSPKYSGDIEIPSEIEYEGIDAEVVGITISAFDNCTTLTSVWIPESVTYIGEGAFNSCLSLESVNIPSGVTKIGSYTFYKCESLTSLVLPDDLTSIEMSAFMSCKKLTSINIPSGVTSLGNYTFYECSSLASLTLPEGITTLGDGVFSGCSSLTSMALPDGVTAIGAETFQNCSNLASVNIPSGVTRIEPYTFDNCSSLTSLSLPDGLTFIGNFVFRNCTDLASIDIPSGVASIGEECFNNCSKFTSIVLPAGLTSIGEYAFAGCSVLADVTNMADTPQEIAENVFANYDASLHVKHGLHTTYGAAPVWQNFTTVIDDADGNPTPTELPDFFEYAGLYYNKISESTVEVAPVPEGVEKYSGGIEIPATIIYDGIEAEVVGIGSNAFNECIDLTSVVLSDGVTYIGQAAFMGCNGLASINIPAGFTSIEPETFYGCESLTSLVLPDGVVSIGESAFAFCTNLASINIPSGVTTIEGSAFGRCESLTALVLPDGVVSIGEYAFSFCANLASINIPAGVTSIGSKAFGGCESLTSIVLPNGLTAIGEQAFAGCPVLADITNLADNPQQIAENTFSNYDATLHVKHGLHTTYGAAPVWQNFATVIDDADGNPTPTELPDNFEYAGLYYNKVSENTVEVAPVPEGVEKYSGEITVPEKVVWEGLEADVVGIGGIAFKDCSDLTAINFPESITYLGESALESCTGLEAIALPASLTTIGGGAFRNCSNLTSLVLPDAVTTIGQVAFYDCTALTSINIPAGVTSIPSFAFTFCGLTSITIPAGVTAIGENAFNACNNLTDVTNLADTPQEISWNVFSNYDATLHVKHGLYTPYKAAPVWQDFGKIVDDADGNPTQLPQNFEYAGLYYNKVSATTVEVASAPAGTVYSGDIEVPEIAMYEGVEAEVVGIADYAFYNCGNLTSVVLPESVTSIGYSAFMSCSNLASLVLPDGLTSIGTRAFQGCANLASINIPSGVTSIGDGTFTYCSSLASLVLPDGLTAIGTGAFGYCSSLESINIPSGVTAIEPNVFGACSSLTSLVLPDGITSIGSRAFSGCENLASINIPSSVTNIDTYAFESCKGITTLTLPDGLTTISKGTFGGCTNLSSINIPSGVTEIGEEAFSVCRSLTTLALPEGLTVIGVIAFGECENLSSINIPTSVTTIGEGAFGYCSSLASITIPSGVTSIGAGVFGYCSALADITNLADTPQEITEDVFSNYDATLHVKHGLHTTYKAAPVWQNFFSVIDDADGDPTPTVLPQNFEYAGLYYNKVSETTVEVAPVPEGVEKYSGDITIPERIVYGDVEADVVGIGSQAFDICKTLTSVSIPESVASISDYAFSGCTGLSSINIPSGVTSLQDRVFEGCSSLTSLILPDGLISIGRYAFTDCINLASINIPSGVIRIEEGAFSNCSSIPSFVLPEGLTTIGEWAFYGCTSITDITNLSGVPQEIESNVFSNYDATLHVKHGLHTTYKEAPVWQNFAMITDDVDGDPTPTELPQNFEYAGLYYNKVSETTVEVAPVPEGVEKYRGDIEVPGQIVYGDVEATVVGIGEYAFAYCDSLASLVLPEGIGYFGQRAIARSNKITTINIPSSVTTIGKYVFDGCRSISSLVMPAGVTSIGEYAFNDCANLTSVNIPSGVTSIEQGTFQKCISLTSLVLPSSITNIGSWVFYECTGLTSISIPSGVTTIEDGTFCGCSSLPSIVIPSNVTSIGEGAFYGCTALADIINLADTPQEITDSVFTNYDATLHVKHGLHTTYKEAPVWQNFFSVIDDADGNPTPTELPEKFEYAGLYYNKVSETTVEVAKIPEYTENYSGDIVIPAKAMYEGLEATVVGIGDYAFFGCENLTSISMAETITYIGQQAFDYCLNLATVNMSENITSIAKGAFFSCRKLESITVPAGITVLEEGVFSGCEILTSVTLPEGLTSIGNSAFSGCFALPAIEIPAGVTHIGEGAFTRCESLTSIVVPEGITKIEDSMFNGCGELTSVTLPSTLTEIGIGAFGGCAFTTIDIPETVNSIGRQAFTASKLVSVVIPEGITTIELETFHSCTSLASVELPSTLTAIENGAFCLCPLTSITFPAGVTSIGDYSFTCDKLQDVTNLSDTPQEIIEGVFSNYGATLHVKHGLHTVYKEAPVWQNFYRIIDDADGDPTPSELPEFFEYAGLYYNRLTDTTVEVAPVPEGVEKYSGDIVIPEQIVYSDVLAEVVGIGEEAFLNCENLTSINLHDGIASIGTAAFFGCSSLTSIVIPEGITELTETFTGCINLSNVSLPQSLVIIGYDAFLNCPKLASIEIPANVSEIRAWAFDYCESLTSIIIPANVTLIGEHAFEDCTSLTDVTNLADTPQEITENVFTNYDATLHVKHGLHTVYKEAPVWSNFFQVIDDADGDPTPDPEPFLVINLDEPGTLADRIYYPEIVEGLTITGPINGTDVNFVRTQLSALRFLNLQGAMVVEGGDAYYSTFFADSISGVKQPLYTSDYVIGSFMFSDMPKLHELMLCERTKNIGTGIIAGSENIFNIEIPYEVESVATGALSGMGNRVIVRWNADKAEVPENLTDNPNVIIYATENYQGDAMRENLVIGDVAEKLVLHDGNDLYIPMDFRAREASYVRNFNKQTQKGTSAGWETIVLPFEASLFKSESRGKIAPFGSEQSVNAHFYLAQLNHEGFELTSVMEANVPYIVSMPNSPEYASQYNITGRVMFYAKSESGVHVMPTDDVVEKEGQIFNLIPSYERIQASPNFYVLNDEEYEGSLPGSVFVQNKEVEPFRPYAVDITGYAPAFMPIFDGNLPDALPIIEVNKYGDNDAVYDLMGLRQNPRTLVPGKVYIINGVKVMYKR